MEETPEAASQLSDNQPQFDSTLRLAIPQNIPQRVAKKSRDENIGISAYSPSAIAASKQRITDKAIGDSASLLGVISVEAKVKTQIHDLELLALSSQRANKSSAESICYLSIGVIQDNQGNYSEAIRNYKLYYQICKDTDNKEGFALACNCLGVDYMLLVSPESDVGIMEGRDPDSQNDGYLNEAVAYHQKHLEVSPDLGGRFIANTNLGLCYGLLGDVVLAAKHHQDSLRVAIKMQTVYGQSIAVGNLGMLALTKKDFVTATTCFEQHLQLVHTLADANAETKAWTMLATVASAEEKYEQALDNLEHAARLATSLGHRNELRRIQCLIGIAKAMNNFGDHVEKILNF